MSDKLNNYRNAYNAYNRQHDASIVVPSRSVKPYEPRRIPASIKVPARDGLYNTLLGNPSEASIDSEKLTRYLLLAGLVITAAAVTPVFAAEDTNHGVHYDANVHAAKLSPDSGIGKVIYAGDDFHLNKGTGELPFTFQSWEGNPDFFVLVDGRHNGGYIARIKGDSRDDAGVLATVGYGNKPDVSYGQAYRIEAEVKLENVTGEVRLAQLLFDKNDIYYPKLSNFGEGHKGTTGWISLTLDTEIPEPYLVKGTPVVEILGEGSVDIKRIKQSPISKNNLK